MANDYDHKLNDQTNSWLRAFDSCWLGECSEPSLSDEENRTNFNNGSARKRDLMDQGNRVPLKNLDNIPSDIQTPGRSLPITRGAYSEADYQRSRNRHATENAIVAAIHESRKPKTVLRRKK